MVQCRKIPTGKVNTYGDEKYMNDKFFDLKQEKQDRMINAALKIFSRKGYKHASTDDIVKEAGISIISCLITAPVLCCWSCPGR